MDPWITGIIGALAGGGAGFWLFYIMQRSRAERMIREARAHAEQEAGATRRDAELRVKEEVLKRREELERELAAQRQELTTSERRLAKREDTLDQKLHLLDRKEQFLQKNETRLVDLQSKQEQARSELAKLLERQKSELQRVSGMSRDEACRILIERVEGELQQEITVLTKRYMERAKESIDEKGRDMLLTVIQRNTAEFVSDSTVSTISIPSDDLKGRIIGREGRNIRAFEGAAGVDVIVDDTPGVVVVSSFDGVRREVARQAMERLVQDGRIHPARIEELIKKVESEVLSGIEKAGREAVIELRLGKVHGRIIGLLGRLLYRTSYGQNVLNHSKEVAWMCGLLAAELGLNAKLAKRCGLLHDIGKAVDHELEGTHPQIGAETAGKCGERPEVVNAIASHHNDVPVESVYGVLVQIGDAISAARPGARRESMERYVQRLEALETIATAQEGVEKAFAIQAGRELRVVLEADRISDDAALPLARKIAQQIEDELSYPGEIRVTVIREKRFVEYAR